MRNEELQKPILIINRQTGNVDHIVKDKKDYVSTYGQMVNMNDVETAIKVWCDFTNQTKRQLLKDFNLIELINVFSTRYIAQVTKPRKKIQIKDKSKEFKIEVKNGR